ncbi:MAG: sigma-70 family RNA polymerase sigma factor [Thermomicrobiales bacterium]|nr:sigma-70 family RNA polymerase sigma factor [Thermomicrobiales bacterium]
MAHNGIDPSMEDDAIVQRARKNVDDFAPLYDRYALSMYRWMCRETGDAELAADLTAQVFVQALQRLHQYDPRRGATFRAWLFAIARNLLRDSWRRYKPGPLLAELVDQRPGPEELALHRTLMDDVRAALEALPERQRETIELRLAGLTHREIAEIQGTSENAVRMAQSRAMKTLRVLLHQGVKT